MLVPAMVTIGNELLAGGKPRPSFLQALMLPLRRKGDSADAMDYRPIALLQTGYKVYAKVIASRVQRVLGTPIGESQQGFVHGRQMRKTVMMMLAQLATAKAEPELTASGSRAILLRHGLAGISVLVTQALWILSRFYRDDSEHSRGNNGSICGKWGVFAATKGGLRNSAEVPARSVVFPCCGGNTGVDDLTRQCNQRSYRARRK